MKTVTNVGRRRSSRLQSGGVIQLSSSNKKSKITRNAIEKCNRFVKIEKKCSNTMTKSVIKNENIDVYTTRITRSQTRLSILERIAQEEKAKKEFKPDVRRPITRSISKYITLNENSSKENFAPKAVPKQEVMSHKIKREIEDLEQNVSSASTLTPPSYPELNVHREISQESIALMDNDQENNCILRYPLTINKPTIVFPDENSAKLFDTKVTFLHKLSVMVGYGLESQFRFEPNEGAYFYFMKILGCPQNMFGSRKLAAHSAEDISRVDMNVNSCLLVLDEMFNKILNLFPSRLLNYRDHVAKKFCDGDLTCPCLAILLPKFMNDIRFVLIPSIMNEMECFWYDERLEITSPDLEKLRNIGNAQWQKIYGREPKVGDVFVRRMHRCTFNTENQ